jgi:L-seryl-tRNA(Ser) seleniumtransferase
METAIRVSIYERIGVKPVINAKGFSTVVGGNTPSPRMKQAMEEAERHYVDMRELLEASGKILARLMGAEAAYVTAGAAAGMALGTAACMAGADPDKMAQLPDTTGLRDTVLIQRPMIYQYDRAVSVHGARLAEIGEPDGCTVEQLDAAIGPNTACVLFPAHLDRLPNVVPLAEVVRLAHAKAVPVLVDAAPEVYPVERFLSFPKSGADLVAYSCKYLGGPNSSGVLVGRADLIGAAALQGFIGFETQTNRKAVGRGYKLDRQEIVCAVVAVEEWLATDHERRLAELERRLEVISRALANLSGVSIELIRQRGPLPRVLHVRVDPAKARRPADEVVRLLKHGSPMIYVNVAPDTLIVNAEPLRNAGEVDAVAERLRALLS